MNRLLTCVVLAALAAPAAACINDSELPNHEREFRSQYRSLAVSPSAAPGPRGHHPLLYGAGGLLLLGAIALTLTGRRPGD